MTILSIAVPSYNSEAYLNKCVDSLLDSGEGIEILIINDGSSDGTKQIADGYATKYPGRIKAIHQENAGHGGAVNTGITYASGVYFKVVDSDDWVNPAALKQVVDRLRQLIEHEQPVDMFIANYMYDKVGVIKKKIMHYRGIIPENRIFDWSEVGKFRPGKYILMHSVIYRMDILKDSGLKLPTHTFYVDNLFVYQPLIHVKSMYYMDVCVYHYFIGREEQSINEKVMIHRIDQQLSVNRLMLENVDFSTIRGRKKRAYMFHYLTIITTVSSVLLLKDGTDEALQKKKILWEAIRAHNLQLYFRMRTSLLGNMLHLPGKIGRKITLFTYKQVQRRVGFN